MRDKPPRGTGAQGAGSDELDSSDDEDHFPPSQHLQMAGGPK